ncbi:calcium/sodium antiporter [Flammeovirga agarivorans]|uniref:Calcium/sodium antiporter n=1 Tax=Flammeovirga agarivorans TaxID=2726742 RepID=A0A7X8XU46_9BACT|nr:calcium/sodium antiporter [Flammeovirga agarivorans]NLR89899.1 calcium/sodium antiporter [Flammeovirga agarivorans]
MENQLIINILELIGGLIVLIGGGEFLVKGSTSFALRCKVPAIIVGLTIVAFGTSSPELFISLYSALQGNADLALGNVVGSNICNLAMVLGCISIIYPVKVSKTALKFDWPSVIVCSLTFLLFSRDGVVSSIEGIVFLLLLFVYIFFLLKRTKNDVHLQATTDEEFQLDEREEREQPKVLLWTKDIMYILTGIISLKFGAEWFINGSKSICLTQLGMSERAVGIFVLALGTSLPELVTSIVAAFKRETDLAFGNLIGSNILNILFVLGTSSLIVPIHVNDISLYDFLWMISIAVISTPLMYFQHSLYRYKGVLLLLLYSYYIYHIF